MFGVPLYDRMRSPGGRRGGAGPAKDAKGAKGAKAAKAAKGGRGRGLQPSAAAGAPTAAFARIPYQVMIGASRPTADNTPKETRRFQAIVAVHLFLLRGNEILLLRRHNTGYEDGNYSVIAGHLDGDEAATIALAREALEEAGIDIAPADLRFALVMHRKEAGAHDERIDLFFAATVWRGEPAVREPEKCSELRWASLNALPENVVPYVRAALDHYLHNRPYAEFWPGRAVAVPFGESGPFIRPGVRVVLIDADERVLLFAGTADDGSRFWFPPGGGIEPGESAEAAARRELREETGLPDVELAGEFGRRRHVVAWGGITYDVRERWFLARVAPFALDLGGFTDVERATIVDHRWWTLDELESAHDRLVPANLAALVRSLLRDGLPEQPIELQR